MNFSELKSLHDNGRRGLSFLWNSCKATLKCMSYYVVQRLLPKVSNQTRIFINTNVKVKNYELRKNTGLSKVTGEEKVFVLRYKRVFCR